MADNKNTATDIINEVELLGGEPTLSDIWRLLKSNTVTSVTDLKQHKEETNLKFVDLDSQVSANKLRIDSLQAEFRKLESATIDANYETELSKQRNLRNNVTVMGIHATNGENLKSIAAAVFACINVKVTESDIHNANRKNNIIVVKLANYDIKANIIQNKTKNKIMACNVCPGLSNDVQVFVNNHTTPYFGRILQCGRNAVRDKKIDSIRLATKGCLMKLSADGDEILVKSVSHFIDILKSISSTSQADATACDAKKNAGSVNNGGNKKLKANNKNSKRRRNRSFDADTSLEKEKGKTNPKSKPKLAEMECD